MSDRNLENYKESAWSSMSELEQQLKQLEMNVAQQFGEVDSIDDDDDDDDDDNDYDDERKCNDNDTAAAADADNYKEEVEDYILDDSLYCIACKKTFKSDKALVYIALLMLLNLGLRTFLLKYILLSLCRKD